MFRKKIWQYPVDDHFSKSEGIVIPSKTSSNKDLILSKAEETDSDYIVYYCFERNWLIIVYFFKKKQKVLENETQIGSVLKLLQKKYRFLSESL